MSSTHLIIEQRFLDHKSSYRLQTYVILMTNNVICSVILKGPPFTILYAKITRFTCFDEKKSLHKLDKIEVAVCGVLDPPSYINKCGLRYFKQN